MKKIIFLLFCVLGLNLSAHAETVRISGLFNSVTGTTSYSDGQSFCMNASWSSNRTPTGDWAISSDKQRIVCSFADSNNNGAIYTMGIATYCVKGGQIDLDKFGCYGEKPANSCPANGTKYQDNVANGEVTSIGTFCSLGCEVMVEVWYGDSSSSTGYIGGGTTYFTGNECLEGDGGTGGEGSGSGGEDGDGSGDGEGSGKGEGSGDGSGGDDGSGTGEGEGSGEGDGDGTGDGDGSGSGDGNGDGKDEEGSGNCVYVNGMEICKEGGNKPDCVWVNGAKVCSSGSGSGSSGDGDGEGDGEDGDGWGGNCEQGFTCEGDALVCAISQAEYVRNCSIIDDARDSDETGIYDNALGNLGEERSGSAREGLPDMEVDIDQLMNSSNLFGTGSPPKNETFTFYGTKQEIPVNMLADLLKWIGIILKMMAFFIAIQIAFG